MTDSTQEVLRKLPSVEAVLNADGVQEACRDAPRRIAVECAREAVEAARGRLLEGALEARDEGALLEEVAREASRRIKDAVGPHYRRVINATGIILHTGLGRAVLAERALRQIAEELSGYSLLQLDVEEGKRCRREERIQWLLRRITGAEAATVVNNNAAATLLVLSTVAEGREVIVSRGQLVEIGGAFRLPEVMSAGGARMVEVGTTNRTHPRDYEDAITEETAAILRCHPSNYVISGFTSEVPLGTLERIAHERGLVLIDDVGAGPLLDFSQFGFAKEPTVPESIRTGADLVTSSADKLIGGPQGGVIVGRRDLIAAVRANPLARAMRVDKMTLAALEATLTLFLDEEMALEELPILQMLRRDPEELRSRAERIAERVRAAAAGADVSVVDGHSQMGSGSLPGQNLPTSVVAVSPARVSAEELARALRGGSPPVFTRIREGHVLIDPRTLLAGEDEEVVAALVRALGAQGEEPPE